MEDKTMNEIGKGIENVDIRDSQEEPVEKKKLKPYKIRENMTGKDFYKHQVDNSTAFEKPFLIQRPDEEDIK